MSWLNLNEIVFVELMESMKQNNEWIQSMNATPHQRANARRQAHQFNSLFVGPLRAVKKEIKIEWKRGAGQPAFALSN